MKQRINPWSLAGARGRVATVPLEAQTYAETAFQGMDSRTSPDRLGPGIVGSLLNGFADGQGGIVGRGAFVGQFTTPLTGGSIWSPIAIQMPGITPTRILFVQGGKLYWT
ncbi:MAG: hypothetical protein QM758_06800 [Armatimonas sp.]